MILTNISDIDKYQQSINTIPGFKLVIFPFLCHKNHKLSNSILNYHNVISVTVLFSRSCHLCYILLAFCPKFNCWKLLATNTSATADKSDDQITNHIDIYQICKFDFSQSAHSYLADLDWHFFASFLHG